MSRLFDRKTEVLVAGNKFVYPGFEIDFRIEFDDDPEPNMGEVFLYNLSDQTTKGIKKGQNIILNAGYGNDTGTIFAGRVEEVNGYWEDVDRVLRLNVADSADRWISTSVNKTYKPGIKASQIIRDMLGIFGLEIGVFSLSEDIVYANGRIISGSIQSALRQIVIKDCKSKLHIRNGAIIIRPPGEGDRIAFVLNADTGLIDSPQRFEREEDGETIEGYNVFSLLNHRIRTDSILQIQSRTANGLYRAIKGQHLKNEMDFMTKMEVVGL